MSTEWLWDRFEKSGAKMPPEQDWARDYNSRPTPEELMEERRQLARERLALQEERERLLQLERNMQAAADQPSSCAAKMVEHLKHAHSGFGPSAPTKSTEGDCHDKKEMEREESLREARRILAVDVRGTLSTTAERVKLEILDLHEGSTDTQQRTQWRRLCRLLHEDKVQNIHKDSEVDKQTCQRAYFRLDQYANPMKEQEFDAAPTWGSSTTSSRQHSQPFDPEPEASNKSKNTSRPWTDPTPRYPSSTASPHATPGYASSTASPYDTPWHASSKTSTRATPGYASSRASTHATDSDEDPYNPNQHPKGTAECYVWIKNDGSNMWFCRICRGKHGNKGRFCTRDHLASKMHKERVADVLVGDRTYIDQSEAPTYDWTTPQR